MSTSHPWLHAAALVAGLAALALARSQAPRIPVPPIRTSLGSMPGAAELPVRPEMPDIMTYENGSNVRTPAQWKPRRDEMKRILAYYATGLMPPSPGNVRGGRLDRRPCLAAP